MSETDLAVLKALFEKHERESQSRSKVRSATMNVLDGRMKSIEHIATNTSSDVRVSMEKLNALTDKVDALAKKQDSMVEPLTLAKSKTNGCDEHKAETIEIQRKLAYLSGRNAVIATFVLLVLNLASGIIGGMMVYRVTNPTTQTAQVPPR